MQISYDKIDNVSVVSLFEDIDYYNSDELEEKLDKELGGTDSLLLLLGEVRYIDSSGLGVLTSVLRKSKEYEKNFIIAELSSDVKNIFELTRLLDFFTIFNTKDEALESLKEE